MTRYCILFIYTYIIICRLKINWCKFYMLHILFINSWQTGTVVLEHEDERALGLHLLQFTEVKWKIFSWDLYLAGYTLLICVHKKNRVIRQLYDRARACVLFYNPKSICTYMILLYLSGFCGDVLEFVTTHIVWIPIQSGGNLHQEILFQLSGIESYIYFFHVWIWMPLSYLL
jgi:hypothetical protein